MNIPDELFFAYACDRCGAPLCERVQVMNLALNYVEELFCLACLAAEQEMPENALADFAREYVYARECFKTPWDQFAARARDCPRLSAGRCFCGDTN